MLSNPKLAVFVSRALFGSRARFVSLALFVSLAAACGSSDKPGPDAATRQCVPDPAAPTYTDLYNKYFAVGTPGHCATDACHSGDKFNVWLCGTTKDSCYRGMTSKDSNLINTASPLDSMIIDPVNSVLSWFNPNGPMPFDTPGPFPEGRAAILAWVNACALNN